MIRYCVFMFVFLMVFYFVLIVATHVDEALKSTNNYGDAMKTECREVE